MIMLSEVNRNRNRSEKLLFISSKDVNIFLQVLF